MLHFKNVSRMTYVATCVPMQSIIHISCSFNFEAIEKLANFYRKQILLIANQFKHLLG